MVSDSALPVISAIVDGVVIIWRGTGGQLLAILPEEISSVAGGGQGGLLPLQRVGAVVILDAIFLEHARLSSFVADLGVGLDPLVAKLIIFDAP
jgi:hypothetical protein